MIFSHLDSDTHPDEKVPQIMTLVMPTKTKAARPFTCAFSKPVGIIRQST